MQCAEGGAGQLQHAEDTDQYRLPGDIAADPRQGHMVVLHDQPPAHLRTG